MDFVVYDEEELSFQMKSNNLSRMKNNNLLQVKDQHVGIQLCWLPNPDGDGLVRLYRICLITVNKCGWNC